ncbi:uncharacterized protein HGUI_02171 [Hanseniaspora guilliermondii]|uniref:Cell wall mannoprotein PIR1-like C-terminal domain-containing protein n=1 Tax=Hanseniaspora guilliermondii TaxID=56406 RepID=A0A1L0B4M2_9ASCO|nr:uncharacterized protein HGUI_02171 [Hanseniaspora guilliermondii]
MQFLNLILTALLAIEASMVSASSHKHSSSQSKELSSTTLSKTTSSTKHSSSAVSKSSTSVNSTITSYIPGHDWKSLTPTNTYQCGFVNYTSTFGVAVKTVTFDSSNSTNITLANVKRDLVAPTQAVDVIVGQVRALASISSGSSGADEVTTTFTRTKTIVSTSVATLSANTTALNETTHLGYNLTLNGSLVNASFSNISFGNISMYGNSSLLNATYLNRTASYLNSTHQVNTTSYNSTTKCSAKLPDFFNDVSCQTNSTLSVTLDNGVLRDASGKIGSIVSSHQFQFNGPWPAEGTIFAKGWSITPENTLALGDNDIFYECLSGDGYYDLYNEFIGSQCIPIQLEVVTLVDC